MILIRAAPIGVLIVVVCTPLAHTWLHSINDDRLTSTHNFTPSKSAQISRKALGASPEGASPTTAGFDDLVSKGQESVEPFLGFVNYTDHKSKKEEEFLEIGPKKNADAPPEWAPQKHGQEINIGKPLLANEMTHKELEVLRKPINIHDGLSEQDQGAIEIGPEMDVDAYR